MCPSLFESRLYVKLYVHVDLTEGQRTEIHEYTKPCVLLLKNPNCQLINDSVENNTNNSPNTLAVNPFNNFRTKKKKKKTQHHQTQYTSHVVKYIYTRYDTVTSYYFLTLFCIPKIFLMEKKSFTLKVTVGQLTSRKSKSLLFLNTTHRYSIHPQQTTTTTQQRTLIKNKLHFPAF